MKDILLYGASGHCYATIELIRSLKTYNPIYIVDDNPEVDNILNVKVEKNRNKVLDSKNLCISIGNNKIRRQIATKINAFYPFFIHPSAQVYPSTTVGKGTVVLPNSVLGAAVKIGDFCIINNNATVSHNAIVKDFCHIAIQAAVAGGVTIGEGTLIGAGSVILPEVKIGKWVTIGAGSIITKDIPDNATVVGNPGKIIKINE